MELIELSVSYFDKQSKDYNSSSWGYTVKFSCIPTEAQNEINKWKAFIESQNTKKTVQENSVPYNPPQTQAQKAAHAIVDQIQSKPYERYTDKDPWNVINEKQIKLLSFTADKNGKGKKILWDKVKETGKFCSFKDGKNNLTKKEFEDLLQWAQS